MTDYVMICNGTVVQGGTAQKLDNWKCTDAITGENKNWTIFEFNSTSSVLEDLTIAEAEAITVAALSIWAIAWGARQLFNHIIEPHRR